MTVMVSGAVSWSEWSVKLGNPPRVATCVEVSEMVVDHLVKAGIPLSNAEDTSLATELIARGEADPDGATNYLAASAQMARLGIPNTPYGQAWFAANNFVPVAQAALNKGIPVLFGFSEAHLSFDDWTGQGYNAGVYGHAIVLVGYDGGGAIVADPNTPQATQDKFVHYSWANLLAAGGQWPSMVIPSIGALPMAWTQQPDGTGKDAAGHSCGTGVMFYLTQHGLATSDGLMSETAWATNHLFLPLASGAIVRAQLGSNGVWSFDDNGAAVLVELWNELQAAQHAAPPAPAPAPDADAGADEATIAALQAQVASLTAQLATATNNPTPTSAERASLALVDAIKAALQAPPA